MISDPGIRITANPFHSLLLDREEYVMKQTEQDSSIRNIVWIISLVLIFAGLILVPMHLRDPFIRLLDKGLKGYSKVNVLASLACVLLLAAKRDYTKGDILLAVIWTLLLVPLLISDWSISLRKTIPAIFNSWLPLYLVFQRMPRATRKRLVHGFLIAFNIFIIILLVYGLYERMTGGKLMAAAINWFELHGGKPSELRFYQRFTTEGGRMCSFWGHALTNGVLFNVFFILNDIYHRSTATRYPKMVYFMISLAGVLLVASKVAIIVSCLYLIISNWKQKKWLIVYAAAFCVMYFLGFFQKIIRRFTTGPITTGRVGAMKAYFAGDLFPLKILTGYGTGTTYGKQMYHLKAAFEPPLLMYSLDYGIIFAVLFLFSIYAYVSWYFLSRRQIASWLGISLYFAQINTYNAMSLWNQDCCWIMATVMMLAVNAVMLSDEVQDQAVRNKEKGVKAALIRLICGE